jgi:hypothetical protein
MPVRREKEVKLLAKLPKQAGLDRGDVVACHR